MVVVLLGTAVRGEAAGKVRSEWLLDGLGAAQVTLPDVKKPPVLPDNAYFQPFWYTGADKRLAPYHKRVIVHTRKEAVRDMRDALTLPAPASAEFEVGGAGDRKLVFAHLSLREKGKGGVVQAEVSCRAGEKSEVVWSVKETPSAIESLTEWPAEVEMALPDWCERVCYTARMAEGNGEAWGVLASPRVQDSAGVVSGLNYNVLFIVVDALRSDCVGVHRTAFSTVSPRIDELEAQGTTFPSGYANGNTTLLSMNAMLLGTHPRAMGFLTLWWGGKDRRPLFYERKPPYLTRLLHDAGYVTFGATHNHLYFPGYRYGVDPGFDVLQDCGRDGTDHPILTRRALEFMRTNKQSRFLVQVNLIGPHQPYAPPEECLEEAQKTLGDRKGIHDARYVGEVAWVDRHVGQLVDGLKEMGLDDETLVVLTADHGEVMDPIHDCVSARNGHRCLHLHGQSLYEEEINVPIMFTLPGVVKERVAPDLVQHVDIVPTILDLVGLSPDQRMTGRSLAPALLEGKTLEEVPVFSERWLSRAVRVGSHKLIFHTAKDDICPPVAKNVCKEGAWWELYDLSSDPGERKEISGKMKEKAAELKALVEKLRVDLYEKSGGDGPNP